MYLEPKPKEVTSTNTSSFITLRTYPEHKERVCYYQWFSENKDKSHSETSSIFTRFDMSKITKNSDYQCTPLNYASILTGRILHDNSGEYQILAELKYGPVLPQQQIVNCLSNPQRGQVKIRVNKSNLVDAKVSIKQQNIFEAGKTFIKVEAENFMFELKMDNTTRLPSNNSFFKFYDKQENVLGVSMYHQHSQFMEKLKGLKIYSHFGFYLKIHFQNRLFRDSFLFEIMQAFGILVPEFKSLSQSKAREMKINFQQSFIISKEEQNHRYATQKNIKSSKHEIDDEIYKLLYEAQQKQAESQSIDMIEAQMLFASTNQTNIKNSKLQNISDCKSQKKKNQFLVQKNENQPQRHCHQPTDFSCFNSQPRIQGNSKPIKIPNHQYFRNTSATEFIHQGSQNLGTTISKLNYQVQKLQKQNKKLLQQNKALKDQNMRLRFRQTKSHSNKPINNKIITTTTNKQIPISHAEIFSPRLSPQKHSAYLFRPSRTENRSKSKFETNQSINTKQRNNTTYLIEGKPESSFVRAYKINPGSSEAKNKNRENFKMASEVLQRQLIKEQIAIPQDGPLNKFQVKKSKTKQFRTSYDKPCSPSRITNDNLYSRIVPQTRQTPSLSQLIPTQLVQTRYFYCAQSQQIHNLNINR